MNQPDPAEVQLLRDRILGVRDRIEAACRNAGRDPASVSLLGASKTVSAQRVVAAVAAGLKLFGENRAQELRDKVDLVEGALPGGQRAIWHFIGRLQRNKVRLVVGRVALVHSVDSVGLAGEINHRKARLIEAAADEEVPEVAPIVPRQPVLVQVDIANEPSKGGVPPDRALELCAEVSEFPHLDLRGLMAIPPFTEDPADAARWFEAVAELAARGRAQGLPLRDLSMGMSHDFEVAIAHGATIVRVGTAIFGERNRQIR
jgi:pyridoxal phosphate enzyme, YggS family